MATTTPTDLTKTIQARLMRYIGQPVEFGPITVIADRDYNEDGSRFVRKINPELVKEALDTGEFDNIEPIALTYFSQFPILFIYIVHPIYKPLLTNLWSLRTFKTWRKKTPRERTLLGVLLATKHTRKRLSKYTKQLNDDIAYFYEFVRYEVAITTNFDDAYDPFVRGKPRIYTMDTRKLGFLWANPLITATFRKYPGVLDNISESHPFSELKPRMNALLVWLCELGTKANNPLEKLLGDHLTKMNLIFHARLLTSVVEKEGASEPEKRSLFRDFVRRTIKYDPYPNDKEFASGPEPGRHSEPEILVPSTESPPPQQTVVAPTRWSTRLAAHPSTPPKSLPPTPSVLSVPPRPSAIPTVPTVSAMPQSQPSTSQFPAQLRLLPPTLKRQTSSPPPPPTPIVTSSPPRTPPPSLPEDIEYAQLLGAPPPSPPVSIFASELSPKDFQIEEQPAKRVAHSYEVKSHKNRLLSNIMNIDVLRILLGDIDVTVYNVDKLLFRCIRELVAKTASEDDEIMRSAIYNASILAPFDLWILLHKNPDSLYGIVMDVAVPHWWDIAAFVDCVYKACVTMERTVKQGGSTGLRAWFMQDTIELTDNVWHVPFTSTTVTTQVYFDKTVLDRMYELLMQESASDVKLLTASTMALRIRQRLERGVLNDDMLFRGLLEAVITQVKQLEAVFAQESYSRWIALLRDYLNRIVDVLESLTVAAMRPTVLIMTLPQYMKVTLRESTMLDYTNDLDVGRCLTYVWETSTPI
jgi:hypothetical protein